MFWASFELSIHPKIMKNIKQHNCQLLIIIIKKIPKLPNKIHRKISQKKKKTLNKKYIFIQFKTFYPITSKLKNFRFKTSKRMYLLKCVMFYFAPYFCIPAQHKTFSKNIKKKKNPTPDFCTIVYFPCRSFYLVWIYGN